jgi:hypothetical protein
MATRWLSQEMARMGIYSSLGGESASQINDQYRIQSLGSKRPVPVLTSTGGFTDSSHSNIYHLTFRPRTSKPHLTTTSDTMGFARGQRIQNWWRAHSKAVLPPGDQDFVQNYALDYLLSDCMSNLFLLPWAPARSVPSAGVLWI